MNDRPKKWTNSREKVPAPAAKTQQTSVWDSLTLGQSLGLNWEQGRREHLSSRSRHKPGQEPSSAFEASVEQEAH